MVKINRFKQAYAKPTLVSYGRVGSITQAGSSGAREGQLSGSTCAQDKPRTCN